MRLPSVDKQMSGKKIQRCSNQLSSFMLNFREYQKILFSFYSRQKKGHIIIYQIIYHIEKSYDSQQAFGKSRQK